VIPGLSAFLPSVEGDKLTTNRRSMAAKNDSSVHPVETTASRHLPPDYQTYRRRSCETEWLRTEWLYSSIDETEGTARLDKLRECRKFAWFARNKHTGLVRVMSNACKLRWCPVCAKARTMHLMTQVGNWLHDVSNPKFATFTMQHTDAPLSHQIKWLYSHFRRFRQRKAIKPYIRGGIWFFQLKRSENSAQWHPHLHCILDADFIPQALLSAEWLAQTLTSSVVDIRAVRDVEKVAEYVARYCARPAQLSEFNDQDCIEIFSVFHGRRLCGSWGSGRLAELTSQPTEDRFDWLKIGSYKKVVAMQDTSARAKRIISCWLSQEPIEDGIKIRDLDEQMNGWIGRAPPDVGIEDLDFNWKGFEA